MFLHILDAKYINDYKIQVTFNNGKSGVADLSEALDGQIFQPLKNIDEFARFKVDAELETLVWPNGADLAPEYIYFQVFKHDKALLNQFREWGYA